MSHPILTGDVDSTLDEMKAEHLRSRGYLVLAPGDTSPVGELVNMAFVVEDEWERSDHLRELGSRMSDVVDAVKEDPAVRAWVERGRNV